MEILPEAMRAGLEAEALRRLIRSLATRVEGRRAGTPVADVARVLMAPHDLLGPERARVYVALRDEIRERVAALEGLRYVEGLS